MVEFDVSPIVELLIFSLVSSPVSLPSATIISSVCLLATIISVRFFSQFSGDKTSNYFMSGND